MREKSVISVGDVGVGVWREKSGKGVGDCGWKGRREPVEERLQTIHSEAFAEEKGRAGARLSAYLKVFEPPQLEAPGREARTVSFRGSQRKQER